MEFNIRRVINDVRYQIQVIAFGIVLCGILLFALLLSSFYVDINALRILMWLSPHPFALILTLALLMNYLCVKDRCDTGRAIISAIIMLFAALLAIVFLILTIVSIFQIGCAAIPACANIQGVFIVVLVLVGILALIELLIFLYLILSVRSNLNALCKRCPKGLIGDNIKENNRNESALISFANDDYEDPKLE